MAFETILSSLGCLQIRISAYFELNFYTVQWHSRNMLVIHCEPRYVVYRMYPVVMSIMLYPPALAVVFGFYTLYKVPGSLMLAHPA